jgi:hypothetical protein
MGTNLEKIDFFSTLTELFSYIATIFSSLGVAKLIQSWKKRIPRRHLLKINEGLEDIKTIFKNLKKVTLETEIDGIIILKGHNSGGIPKPGSPYYITSIYADHKDPEKCIELQDKYVNFKIDNHYTGLLINLINNKLVKLELEELEECIFKKIMISDEFNYSELHFLTNNKSEIYYVLIYTDINKREFEKSKNRIEIEIAISNFQRIFKKYYY